MRSADALGTISKGGFQAALFCNLSRHRFLRRMSEKARPVVTIGLGVAVDFLKHILGKRDVDAHGLGRAQGRWNRKSRRHRGLRGRP